MQEVDEGEGYSDDDLDALPADTFQELQQNAIRSTQQLDHNEQPALPSEFVQGLSKPENLRRSFGHLAISGNAFYKAPTQAHPQEASSDYGEFDDEMLDGEIFDAAEEPVIIGERLGAFTARPPGENTQREQWRQQRFGAPPRPQSLGASLHSLPARPLPAPQTFYDLNGQNHHEDGGNSPATYEGLQRPRELSSQEPSNVRNLEAQVQKLLQERDQLQEAVNSANNTAQSKIGEIAIIRANESKARKENEKRLLDLQKLHTDEVARHKVEVERVLAEQKKLATEKYFLEFNLVQENERIKSLQRTAKEDVANFAPPILENKKSPFTTPKKNKSRPYGDGFNDDDIQMTSPPKLVLRPKAATPKAGEKRKRKPVEGRPVQPLLLSQSVKENQPGDSEQIPSEEPPVAAEKPRNENSEKFKLTQQILNHRITLGQRRTFEALAGFAYPSDPSQALSTIFLDKISALTFKLEIEDYPAALGRIIVSLWSQCIDEKYVGRKEIKLIGYGFAKSIKYSPVYLLMDLIKYLLLISPSGTGSHLTEDIVNKAQTIADINLIPRFQGVSKSKLKVEIDTKECLQILHLIAYDCLRTQTEIEHFWRAMRFDFVIMMVNGTQPMEELRLAVNLLRTSVLESSFSMRITPGDGNQIKTQGFVIERLSRLLVDSPSTREDAEQHDIIEIAQLRLEVLSLMQRMCDSRYCGEALATHKMVIGRLVRVMNDELGALYDFHYGHEYRAELVNHSTRLLFHLTSNYASQIDLQAKLRVIPGGTHKYLVGLTRLAFSEGVFFERGIEEDVAECAHQMLETLVNPQEAEALLEAFSSARK